MNSKTAVLLINLGTPDSPAVKDVRKYLQEFLMDGRVIDVPFIQRFFLVNGIIAPFRSPKSAHEYSKLWTKNGSPLLLHGLKLKELLQQSLGDNYIVELAMRYQSPSIRSVLDKFEKYSLDKIIVIPLYPQYASASTGSTIEKVMQEIKRWEIIPEISFISQFPDDPLFIQAFAQRINQYTSKQKYDHFIFTYHGLPQRQILKSSTAGYCQINKCCNVYHSKNQYCYRAQCFQTTRKLAEELNLKSDQYSVTFQSRLGKDPWIPPYTDEIIPQLAKKGIKKILAVSPSFIADCLETTVEIAITYKDLFLSLGGERFDMVESLNDHPVWIECLKNMVKFYDKNSAVKIGILS